jgi:DNA-binding winged helix-turn-helix (wHTH) protein/TolB-like protein
MPTQLEEVGAEASRFCRFGEFELDLAEETLSRSGEKLNINRRMFQVLRLLVERNGEIVTKQEFFDKVWDGSFVEDNNLTVAVTSLRKVLGDNAKQAKYIENIPRKGYRFIAKVTGANGTSGPALDDSSATNVQVTDFNRPVTSSATFADHASETKNVSSIRIRKLAAGILIASLISLLAIGVVGYRGFWRSSPTAAVGIDSIAILPFSTNNSDSEYLADGLTDGITSDLSRISRIRVIDRSSTFQYKNQSTDPVTAGRELKVRAVVTGQVEQQDIAIVIDVKMIDLVSGQQIWQQQFRRRKGEFFSTQQEISQAILKIAVPEMTRQDQSRLTRRQTDDPEAYDLYLKGRYFWNKRTNPDFMRSVELFRAAIDRDPTFARAYVGLADAYSLGGFVQLGISNEEKIALARGAIKRALEIDDTLGEAYASLAINKCYIDWDFPGAESDYVRAIELNPNDATAHHWYAEFLGMQGRFEESFKEYDRAMALDPLSLPIRTDMALNYYYARNYDAAIENLNKAKELDPNYVRTYDFLNLAYREKGMFAEAADAIDRRFTIQSQIGEVPAKDLKQYRAYTESLRSGARREGAPGYWQAELKYQEAGQPPSFVAVAYAKLGDKDSAFKFLEKAFNERYSGMVWLKVNPELDSLRSDPRYDDLMRRVGF